MSLQHYLLGKPDAGLKAQWLSHVRSYGPHQSKPAPGPFELPARISGHPLRYAGVLFPALRRASGLALRPPGPNSAGEFKVWEMPGNEYTPGLPYALLGQELDASFRDYLPSFESRSSFILRIPGGLFHGHDHTLFDQDFHLIDWEPPYWAADCGLPGTMFRGRMPRPTKLRGRALVLSAPGATNNLWHLLFDSLPKLHLIEQAGMNLESFDHLLVNSTRAPFERDALNLLGVPPGKIVETDEISFVQADELVFVTLGCLIPTDPWVLRWVRSKFMPPTPSSPHGRRIFLSRADAGRRRLRGEGVVWQELHAQGFEKVEFGTMTLSEQIECVRSASAIVAPHGAGLTNLVWAEPGTRVVELFSSKYVSACYWLIADMLGLEYAFAIDEPTTARQPSPRAILDVERLGADIVFAQPQCLAELAAAFCRP
jgi:capsular polysaccharide biosynthesis protein